MLEEEGYGVQLVAFLVTRNRFTNMDLVSYVVM